jgi:alkanesulfonate monooxygenase SsuD/methylene tetrahydromethanopterin reductase-like flavin-dependent oxidoreductase (luciferase family)
MRFGVLLLPTDPWADALARARHIEALGYDHLWTYDHLSWRRYRGRRWFSAVPWLTGIAGGTDRIRLGTMVASPNMRHPLTLAQDVVTADHVSGGRFVLGLGAGGIGVGSYDSTVFGGEPLTRKEVTARFGEFVELIDRLLLEPTVSYAGDYYTVHEACVQPACVQTPRVPLALAATGPRSLALAARYADAWITFGDPSDLTAAGTDAIVRTQSARLDDACSAIGRDPGSIERIYMIGNTEEHPLASVAAFEDFTGRYAALGFTDLVFHHPRADDPVWPEPEQIVDDIAREVLPRRH